MKWLRSLLLFACTACLSCSSDGGPAGTGISSTSAISGNVVGVQVVTPVAASTTTTAGPLPPIHVSIDGVPNAATIADSSGNFVLSGTFSGTVTVRFAVPQFQVTHQLDVPEGSTVVLQDIELQPDAVVAQAAWQFDFYGTVDLVDCADGTLLMHEHPADGEQFLVHLSDQTSFVDATGNAQTCAAIHVGSPVIVEGPIAYATDRTIQALVVTIAPRSRPSPRTQVETQFSGTIAALDCGAGVVVVDDSVQRTTLQLTMQTTLSGASGALACQDLHLGDSLRGEGLITVRMPGTIVATQLIVTGPPDAGQALRFIGFVRTIDCAAGALQLHDDDLTIDVQLTATTVIAGGHGQPLTCEDIDSGDRVKGVGRLTADGSATLDAVQITVLGREFGNALKH